MPTKSTGSVREETAWNARSSGPDLRLDGNVKLAQARNAETQLATRQAKVGGEAVALSLPKLLLTCSAKSISRWPGFRSHQM